MLLAYINVQFNQVDRENNKALSGGFFSATLFIYKKDICNEFHFSLKYIPFVLRKFLLVTL